MKTIMVILKILFVGALVIVSNYDLHLSDQEERQEFFSLYKDWGSTLFRQGFDVTGYVVKFEWLPELPEEVDSG